MKTVVGIDLGTQSIKVIFYNAETKRIEASSSANIQMNTDGQGRAEQDASWWTDALEKCMSDIADNIKDSAKAIGVSGQQHGFVALAGNGDVLAPVKLWCDTTTVAESDEINQRFGGKERCIEQLGNVIVTGFTAPKILWLKKYMPEAYQNLDTILLPHDYLNFYLTGTRAMEYGDASGTGLLDIRSREWNREIIQLIDSNRDLSPCLPKLVSADTCIGKIRPEISRKLGLPEGIPVSAGGGDNMMAAIGTGNVSRNIVTVSLGSSGTVYTHNQDPVIDSKGRLAAFCSSTNGWLPLLCTMNCTLATELMRKLFDVNLDELEKLLACSPPGSNGVLSLPFFNGERSPNLPNAKASILGLNSTNCDKGNILRATMEGATFGLRLGIEALKDNGIQVSEIRLTGGGSKSKTWRQLVSDICEVSVVTTSPDEGAAFGAALQALYIYKTINEGSASIQEIVDEHVLVNQHDTCIPKRENVALYNELYRQYSNAVTTLTPYYQ